MFLYLLRCEYSRKLVYFMVILFLLITIGFKFDDEFFVIFLVLIICWYISFFFLFSLLFVFMLLLLVFLWLLYIDDVGVL